jgi:hypothetical protein
MLEVKRRRGFSGEVTRYLLLAVVATMGLQPPGFAEEQHICYNSFAPARNVSADSSTAQSDVQATGAAYDLASAMWMQFFGESAFIAARTPVKTAMQAMRLRGWLAPNTDVVISMHDARRDFAQFDGARCTAHINIDNTGSSPVIAALGNLSSSVTFVAAHELAHCRFDALPIATRLPERKQLAKLGVGNHLVEPLLKALRHPSANDGSAELLTSYDEALADAVATIALVRAETTKQHFGTALDRAQSLRFGELAMANRDAIPAAEHQGGFVFDPISRQAPKSLDWSFAKLIAMQSVFETSFYLSVEPVWFKNLTANDQDQAHRLRERWHERATSLLLDRPSDADEALFYAATGDALLSIDGSQFSSPGSEVEPESALRQWKKIAWQSSDASTSKHYRGNINPARPAPVRAIAASRNYAH